MVLLSQPFVTLDNPILKSQYQIKSVGVSTPVAIAVRSNASGSKGTGSLNQVHMAKGTAIAKQIEVQPKVIEAIDRATDRQKQQHAQLILEGVVEASSSKGMVDPASSGHKSRADQVDEESNSPKARSSVWDNFGIPKVSNAGFKLEYVAPTMQEVEGVVPSVVVMQNAQQGKRKQVPQYSTTSPRQVTPPRQNGEPTWVTPRKVGRTQGGQSQQVTQQMKNTNSFQVLNNSVASTEVNSSVAPVDQGGNVGSQIISQTGNG
ncbi:hypothetical protein K7X08_019413 [Anisodus acutangulus]|uniref:Uncharacterized protein n=1 Tax=Anisodus acutangulus TaxID=402998 RepID=A0A9Q1MRJ2_9SOLA|nr:hypothetical protein K7X08_019413 [Anisodus acutangulus]